MMKTSSFNFKKNKNTEQYGQKKVCEQILFNKIIFF